MTEHYLGIDVGWDTKKNTTGLCMLSVNEMRVTWKCLNTGTNSDRRIRDLKCLVPEGTAISGVGVDGPLAGGLRLIENYRSADALLSTGIFQKRGKPGQVNVPVGQDLHKHATQLARIALALHSENYLSLDDATHPDSVHPRRIVEAFPTAFMAVLLPEEQHSNPRLKRVKRGERSDVLWSLLVELHLLEESMEFLAHGRTVSPPLSQTTNHDHRAAFICALAALCVTKKQYVAVGDAEDGHIILPPVELWGRDADGQRWAEKALRNNIPKVRINAKVRRGQQARVTKDGKEWLP